MKTICPHCKQEFTETPDEYLGMTLECPVCQKEFVCEKPKFCSECGAINPAKALKCAQCGKFFPLIPQQPVSPPAQNYDSGQYTSMNDDGEDDCFMEEVDIFTAWRKNLNFCGRSCRKECWLYALPNIVIFLILSFLIPGIVPYIVIVFALVSVPLGVRRLHDMGLSGWCILLNLIFYPLWLALLICPSQPGENKWGPNPVGVSSDNRPQSVYIFLSFVAAIAATAVMVLPVFISASRAREEVKKQIDCSYNMKLIGPALALFETDNPDKFPQDLQTLLTKKYLSKPTDCQCPSTGKRYVYLGNGLCWNDTKPTVPVVMDSPSSHGKKINILYMGGYVQVHKLSREMTSCVDVLKELHPELSQSPDGRIVLENAKKVDEAQIR